MTRLRHTPPDSATRRGGVFLTPLPFAKKACEYLDTMLGKHWLQSGKYRLWDMAAGTGNLEHFLPKESQQYCYLSTLQPKDVEHLKAEFPAATVFQYDYLENTGAGVPAKLPDKLQSDLAKPEIKWVILVNPPYATAQEAGLTGKSKEGVSDTKVRKQMHADGLGEVSRELYVQFLYRIMNEFKHRKAVLGVFAPLKYLVSTNYQKFRDNVFHAAFHSGFMFSSENFGGTSKTKHFPVSFILWDIQQQKNLTEQEIRLALLNNAAQTIGTKTVTPAHRSEFLSRWIKRPRGTEIFPPFSSALTIKTGNADTRNRIAEGFLASLMCPGNELQNQQQTAFLSGPQVSAGALSVTPENFEQAVVVFAARRIPKDTWCNHVDQLMKPNRELAPQFISDCAVWSLFDSKNQTVSLGDVVYQERTYRIVNHFFPFFVSHTKAQRTQRKEDTPLCPSCLCEKNKRLVRKPSFRRKPESRQAARNLFLWIPACAGMTMMVNKSNNNSFVADWLSQQQLSAEALAVLDCAREIYQLYFARFAEPPDAGWYQIQKALRDAKLGDELFTEMKQRHEQLREKILPQLYDYGIVHRNPA